MAISNFISTIWSETLYRELSKNYVGVKLSTREFEGDIKGEGDRVKIAGIGPVSVFNYTKNTDMPSPEILSDNERTLIIDQAKGFNFFIDDVDYVLLRALSRRCFFVQCPFFDLLRKLEYQLNVDIRLEKCTLKILDDILDELIVHGSGTGDASKGISKGFSQSF